MLKGHVNEGIEYYVPYEDRIASVAEKGGKPVFACRRMLDSTIILSIRLTVGAMSIYFRMFSARETMQS